jgi:RNA polymerase sigma-70 factor (ECF subfamily)
VSSTSTHTLDPPGFTTLMAQHRGILVKVAASYATAAEDRADLMQDIALQLWRAWSSYDPARTFSTWMYRIALNVAISWQRRPRPLHEALGTEHEELIGAHDVDAEARDRLTQVQRAMHSLGRVDRALLLLHLDGCSQRESAEVLGTSESNVATRLGRIRQRLRRLDDDSPVTQGEEDGNE